MNVLSKSETTVDAVYIRKDGTRIAVGSVGNFNNEIVDALNKEAEITNKIELLQIELKDLIESNNKKYSERS